MTKRILIFLLLFIGSFLLLGNAMADVSEKIDINFPIADLGNCESQESCKIYCDNPDNLDVCLQFAKEHRLLSEKDIKIAEKFISEAGPGGCQGPACRDYCQNPEHQPECLDFARQRGFISEKEYNLAKKVTSEGGPGGCRSESQCRTYCENPDNLAICADFAEEHGFISKEDAKFIKKSFGEGPGGCKGEQCKEYCDNPDNQASCIDWAEQNGFMTSKEAQFAKKFAGKTGPGGCNGDECKNYCENPEYQEECFNFAKENGLMPKEEIERAEKFLNISKTGGPGGCKGKECRTYCENPKHQEECFNFAKKQGLMTPEEEENFKVGRKLNEKLRDGGGPGGCKSEQECRDYCSDPDRAEECIAFASAHGGIPEDQARTMLKRFTEKRFDIQGEFQNPSDFEKRFSQEHESRFEQFRQLESTFRGGSMGRPEGLKMMKGRQEGQFVGPGGCTSPDDCIKYCVEHKEKCFSFGPPGQSDYRPTEGGIPPERDFPRIQSDLIREFKESEMPFDYERCKTNPEECAKYMPQPSQFPNRESSKESEQYPSDFKTPDICPKMPTVTACAPNELLYVIYESPECGKYYDCKPGEDYYKEDPSLMCAKSGGSWDGSNCTYSSYGRNCPGGTYWNGSSCISGLKEEYREDPASSCTKYGGSWDGTKCNPLSPTR